MASNVTGTATLQVSMMETRLLSSDSSLTVRLMVWDASQHAYDSLVICIKLLPTFIWWRKRTLFSPLMVDAFIRHWLCLLNELMRTRGWFRNGNSFSFGSVHHIQTHTEDTNITWIIHHLLCICTWEFQSKNCILFNMETWLRPIVFIVFHWQLGLWKLRVTRTTLVQKEECNVIILGLMEREQNGKLSLLSVSRTATPARGVEKAANN